MTETSCFSLFVLPGSGGLLIETFCFSLVDFPGSGMDGIESTGLSLNGAMLVENKGSLLCFLRTGLLLSAAVLVFCQRGVE